jgi:cell division protein ZapA (FtsZ GTPase activity inhibitor)
VSKCLPGLLLKDPLVLAAWSCHALPGMVPRTKAADAVSVAVRLCLPEETIQPGMDSIVTVVTVDLKYCSIDLQASLAPLAADASNDMLMLQQSLVNQCEAEHQAARFETLI